MVALCTRCVLAGMAAFFASAAPEVRAETPVIPRVAGTVQIDGRLLEPGWKQALRFTHHDFSMWKRGSYGGDPSEFVLRLMHDGAALHVSLASYDGFVESAGVPEESDGLYAFSVESANGALKHYRLRWSENPPLPGGQMISEAKWAARLRGVFDEPRQEGGGYVLEFSIPLEKLGLRPGRDIAVNVIVQDHDGNPGDRNSAEETEFARFALGSFNNDDVANYFRLSLAP